MLLLLLFHGINATVSYNVPMLMKCGQLHGNMDVAPSPVWTPTKMDRPPCVVSFSIDLVYPMLAILYIFVIDCPVGFVFPCQSMRERERKPRRTVSVM